MSLFLYRVHFHGWVIEWWGPEKHRVKQQSAEDWHIIIPRLGSLICKHGTLTVMWANSTTPFELQVYHLGHSVLHAKRDKADFAHSVDKRYKEKIRVA